MRVSNYVCIRVFTVSSFICSFIVIYAYSYWKVSLSLSLSVHTYVYIDMQISVRGPAHSHWLQHTQGWQGEIFKPAAVLLVRDPGISTRYADRGRCQNRQRCLRSSTRDEGGHVAVRSQHVNMSHGVLHWPPTYLNCHL